MPIVQFRKFHSKKARNKEAYELSDTAFIVAVFGAARFDKQI